MSELLRVVCCCLLLLWLLVVATSAQQPAGCDALGANGVRCQNDQKCIPKRWLCDGVNDCLDWSDEQDCVGRNCSELEIRCDSYCLPAVWRCDGDRDCPDGSDEIGCAPVLQCGSNQYGCAGGQCVPMVYRCDGDTDCSDGSDERDCQDYFNGDGKCHSYQFQCISDNKCVSASWQCDGVEDCPDGSDEINCNITTITCQHDQFDCNGRECVAMSLVCNGRADCTNGEDEVSCDVLPTGGTCMSDQFECSSGICIPASWQCDGEEDCDIGEDELACGTVCKADQFHCASGDQCVGVTALCDDQIDCADKSDEHPNRCAHVTQMVVTCEPDQFHCLDYRKCLVSEYHCDNKTQCRDGSDEWNCTNDHKNECSEGNGGCQHMCHDTLGGYYCSCHHGYLINKDQHSCDDIDECNLFSPCAQLCANTNGRFNCSCVHGFEIQGSDCISNDATPYIVYSDRTSLRKSEIDGSNNNVLISDLHNAIAIDYHHKYGYIFWSDVSDNVIYRSSLNGTTGPIVVLKYVGQCTGIAIDWVNDKLYWTDIGSQTIEVSSLDGIKRRVLFSEDVRNPRAIVLDPHSRYVYWSDWGNMARIERASMDGSHRTLLHSSRLVWPNALAIDLIGQTLFWADGKLHVIEASRLDGTNRRIISSSQLSHPFGLDQFGQLLVYTDWKVAGLVSTNKSSEETHVLASSVQTGMMGVKVIHTSQQKPAQVNPCEGHQCSYMCLLSSAFSATCVCPTGSRLAPDKHSCIDPETFLIFAASFDVRTISLDVYPWVDTVLPLDTVHYAVGIDWSEDIIYWTDARLHTISALLVSDPSQQWVVMTDMESKPMAVSWDWVNEKLYWADDNRNVIEVMESDGSNRRVLLYTGLDKPLGLQVDPLNGLMFWTDWGNQAKIESANMDGTNRKQLVSHDLVWPNGVAVDSESQLVYWTDAKRKVIEYCDYNGDNRIILIDEGVPHPFGIVLHDDHIYWTDWESERVQRANKLTGNNRTVIRTNLIYPNEIALYHLNRTTVSNPCESINCSYICLLTHHHTGPLPQCICPLGVALGDDHITCATDFSDYIIFSVFHSLRILSLDVPTYLDDASNIDVTDRVTTVTIDPRTEQVFWLEDQTVVKSSHGNIVSRNRLRHFDVDYLRELIYWTDNVQNVIGVSNYDGLFSLELINGFDGLASIALDLHNNYLFVIDFNHNNTAVIKRAELDGSNLIIIVDTTPAGCPTSLTIDYHQGISKLYWTDSCGKNIMVSEIDGSNPMALVSGLSHSPSAIVVSTDTIYWSEFGRAVIRSVDKLFPQIITNTSVTNSVAAMALFQRSYNTSINDTCELNNCPDLCLANHNGHMCASLSEFNDFVLYGDGQESNPRNGHLYSIPLNVHGKVSSTPTVLLSKLGLVQGVDFYHVNQTFGYIYWSDTRFDQAQINRVTFSGDDPRTLVANVLSEGIAIDWISGNLYWTDFNSPPSVSVISLDGRWRKKIVTDNIVNPRGIAVHPMLGKVFWSDLGQNCSGRIEVSDMDGSNRRVLVQLNETNECCSSVIPSCGPSSLALNYSNNLLYWVDSMTSTINSISIHGDNYTVIKPVRYPFGLAIHSHNFIYSTWDDSDSQLIQLSPYPGGFKERPLTPIPNTRTLSDVAMVTKRPPGINSCSTNNGNCQYLCIPISDQTHRCVCPDNVEQCIEQESTTVPTATTTDSTIIFDTTTPPNHTSQNNDGFTDVMYVAFGLMVLVFIIVLLLVIVYAFRHHQLYREMAATRSNRSSVVLTTNEVYQKPNNMVDQLPRIKNISSLPTFNRQSQFAQNICESSDHMSCQEMAHKPPKTVNVVAPQNVDPSTPVRNTTQLTKTTDQSNV